MRKTSPSNSAEQSGLSGIINLVTAYRSCRTLTTAVYLGVFDALSEKQRSAHSVAGIIGAKDRTTEILLDCLAAMGFLVKKKDLYRNNGVSERFLTKKGQGGLPCNLRYQELLAGAWADLPRVIKTGVPKRSLGEILAKDKAFGTEYIRAMADISLKPAREIAGLLDLSSVRDILDVGAGPGTYSRIMLERAPGARAVLLDLPQSARTAARILSAFPERKRMKFRVGDYNSADLGNNAYDLVLFSHITHDEGYKENAKLITKAFRAMRSGGKIVIHDFMLEPDRTRPLFGALFSVHMMVYTKAGKVYTQREYGKWLMDAGFVGVKCFKICAERENTSKVLIASKP